jgi:hypothetical protein
MKKIILLATVLFLGTGCKKDAALLPLQEHQQAVAITGNNAVNAVPINFSETLTVVDAAWNSCEGEYIDFSGTGYVQIHGVISNNKITYVLHYNVSNVKGYGRTTGTAYVTTSTFNYSNTFNFNTQFVYQQNATTNYIAIGKDADFTVENDWHLTVNANGVATFFFSTGGEIVTCR